MIMTDTQTPAVESAGNTIENSTQTASETATAAEIKKFRVKVDGSELEVPETELIANYQKGVSADKRFKEAAELKKQIEQFVGQVKENPELLLEQLGINPYEYYESRLVERIRAQQQEQQLTPEAKELKELKQWRDQFEEQQKQQQYAQQEAMIAKALDDEFAATFAEMGITKPTVEMVADVAEQMLAEYKASKQRLPVKEAINRSKNSFQNRLKTWTDQNPEKFLELLPDKYAEKFVETYLAKKQGVKTPAINATKTPARQEKLTTNLQEFFKRGY
jgi:hypothetical protein